ncbi:MAG: hypothetical protein ACLGI6_02130 [Gammaproteobacteria bacterium]
MKKTVLFTAALIAILLVMGSAAAPGDVHMVWDGNEIDGPFAALAGVLAAGGGIAIAGAVMLFVGVLLALVLAGVGVVIVGALAFAAAVACLALTPLLLPAVIPLAIIWLIVRACRKPAPIKDSVTA